MALSRVKTWIAAEVLLASDLNAEFNNLINNAGSLISPATANFDLDGFSLVMDSDADSTIKVSTDDLFEMTLAGVSLFHFDGTTASSVNGMIFYSAATGNGVRISPRGSDADIPLLLRPKGTTTGIVQIEDGGGNEIAKFGPAVASAINEMVFKNSAAGNPVTITATGGDTDVSINLVPKGSGRIQEGGTAIPKNNVAQTWTATQTMSGKPIEFAEGAAVTSAATADIWTPNDGNTVHITGSTGPITSLGTAPQAGAWRFVVLDSTPTLTHGASLILPGGANIVAAAGDTMMVYADTTTVMRVLFYTRADGRSVIGSQASDTVAGDIEIAIQSEMETATDNTRAVPPGRQHFHPGHPKAWGKADVAAAVVVSYNMTSVADNGAGDATWTIATDFATADYVAVATNLHSADASRTPLIRSVAAGTVQQQSYLGNTTLTDPTHFMIACLGDQT